MYVRQLPEVNVAAVTRHRNPRGQGDQLRGDLIRSALALLSASGDPEDVSIRAVAKAAGVSPTAAYRHFHDRDDLVEAACAECFALFTVVLVDAVAGVDDPFEAIRRSGRAYVDFARSDEGLYRVLFSNPLHLDKGAGDEVD